MALSNQDKIALLEKAWELIDSVIFEHPDDNDIDDMDSPISYLLNACGDIQDAINLIPE